MAVPPPFADPTHLEARLTVWLEMLERSVAEVNRVAADIRGAMGTAATSRQGPTEPPRSDRGADHSPKP